MQRVLCAAAVLLLAAAPAVAQESKVSEQEVRDFLAGLDREASEAVASKDWQGIQGWMSEHVAAEAPIFMKGQLATASGMAFSYEAAMKGSDLTQFLGMAGSDHGWAKSIENYKLMTDVHSISELPTGWASAVVVFHESGTIPTPKGAATADTTAAETLAFESVATCAFRFAKEDEAVQIRLAACEVSTMM